MEDTVLQRNHCLPACLLPIESSLQSSISALSLSPSSSSLAISSGTASSQADNTMLTRAEKSQQKLSFPFQSSSLQ